MMALRDSGCGTTLIDESLALSLGLGGKVVDLERQRVNERCLIPSTSRNAMRTSRKRGCQILLARSEDNS